MESHSSRTYKRFYIPLFAGLLIGADLLLAPYGADVFFFLTGYATLAVLLVMHLGMVLQAIADVFEARYRRIRYPLSRLFPLVAAVLGWAMFIAVRFLVHKNFYLPLALMAPRLPLYFALCGCCIAFATSIITYRPRLDYRPNVKLGGAALGLGLLMFIVSASIWVMFAQGRL